MKTSFRFAPNQLIVGAQFFDDTYHRKLWLWPLPGVKFSFSWDYRTTSGIKAKKHWLTNLLAKLAGGDINEHEFGSDIWFTNPNTAFHLGWVLTAYGLAKVRSEKDVLDEIPF